MQFLKKGFVVALCLCFVCFVRAQGVYHLFEYTSDYTGSHRPALADDEIRLQLKSNVLAHLLEERPDHIILSIPSNTGEMRLELEHHQILAPGFVVRTSEGKTIEYEGGRYYKGHIQGTSGSVATVSVFGDRVMGVASDEQGNYVLGSLKDEQGNPTSQYIFYNDRKLKERQDFTCHTDDLEAAKSGLSQQLQRSSRSSHEGQCITVYFECDYEMYQDNGSDVENVVNFTTGMFNEVATLYENENIATAISEIYVWTAPDPFINESSSSDVLSAFRDSTNNQGGFSGDLAHLLSTRGDNLGGIAYVNVLCYPSFWPSAEYAFSNIQNSYNIYPNYSWTVMVVSHEMGHNVGSRHTHRCGYWGQLGGDAVDSCWTLENGPCNTLEGIPSNGGTIMSYCHLQPVGVNFSRGFGQYPGDTLRHYVSVASCLDSCPQVPVNDTCEGAIELVSAESCNWTAGTTNDATESLPAVACDGNTGDADADVWYKFSAVETAHTVEVQGSAGFDAVVDVRSGACDGTNMTCADATGDGGAETVNLTGLTVGMDYLIRIYHFGSGAGSGLFDVCVTHCVSSAAPSGATASPNEICPGSASILEVQGGSLGTGASWQWYSGSCGATAQGSGNIRSVSPSSTTDYFVRAEGDCDTTVCASVTVTVKDTSTIPSYVSAAPDTICPGDTSTLSLSGGALGTNGTWKWYHGNCGGTVVGSGDTLVVSPATTTAYFVRAEADCDTTPCTSVTVTVQDTSTIPSSISAAPDTICPGDTSMLTLSGGSLSADGSWQWYSDSCGGTAAGTGDTLLVSPAITTVYFVRAEAECDTTPCTSVTVTVQDTSTIPSSISAAPDTICPGDTSMLTLSGGSFGANGTWKWYSDSCGGTAAGTGDTLLVSPAITTVYFVRAESDCDTTACVSVTVTVKNASILPGSASAAPATVCPGDTSMLTLSGGSLGANGSWQWYSDSCGGTATGAGDTLSVIPDTTTTYFVRAEDDCGTTSCASVVVTIGTPVTPVSGRADPDTICPGDTSMLSLFGGSRGANGIWKWYSDSCGETAAGTGDTLSVSPDTTTTYFVRAESDCDTTDCVSVTVRLIKDTAAAPVSVRAAPDTICSGDTVILSLSGGSLGANGSWQWYSDGCGTTAAGVGDTLLVSPTSTTDYFVRAEHDCGMTSCEQVTVSVSYMSLATNFSPADADKNNGRAWVTVNGGFMPYTYAWNDAAAQTEDTALNLAAGIYTVTVTDAVNCRRRAAIEVEEAISVLSLEQNTPAWQVYPNPVDNTIYVKLRLPVSQPVSIAMYNLLGQVIFRHEPGEVQTLEQTFSVEELATGVYFLELKAGDGMEHRKVIVDHK